jgi:ribosomal protein L20
MSARSRSNGSRSLRKSPFWIARLANASVRSSDLTARTIIEIQRASNQRIQRRGDDLLGRNVVDEQQHLGSQHFQRGHGLGEVARCGC